MFESSKGVSGANIILFIFLALVAGMFAGTFLDRAKAETPVPSTVAIQSIDVPSPGTEPGEAGVTPSPVVETVAVGTSAPQFTLNDLFDDQQSYTLSDYLGRPVVLNFWASWCVPCRREMPALQATAARYEADGLMLLGMNQTSIDDLEAARAFVEELQLTFPQTRDDSGAASKAYQVVGIPTTVFVTPEGAVAHVHIGEMSLEQVDAYTERLVTGEPLQP